MADDGGDAGTGGAAENAGDDSKVDMSAMPQLPTQEIIDAVTDKFGEFKDKYEEKLAKIQEGWEEKKGENKPYDVIGQRSKVLATLTKDTKESKVKQIACLLALEDGFADEIADAVWEVVEPKLDEAKPEGMSDIAWGAGKRVLKIGVSAATETAVKASLEELVPGSSSTVVIKSKTAAAETAKTGKPTSAEKVIQHQFQ